MAANRPTRDPRKKKGPRVSTQTRTEARRALTNPFTNTGVEKVPVMRTRALQGGIAPEPEGPTHVLLHEYLVTVGAYDLGKGAYAYGFWGAFASGAIAPDDWGGATCTSLYLATPTLTFLGSWSPADAEIDTTTLIEIEADGVFYEYPRAASPGFGEFAIPNGTLVLYPLADELTTAWTVADAQQIVRFYADA